ncbi:MAG: hypothetical protein ACTSP4_05490 [Candidatus Hodarchaeales archaeon]
MNHYHDQRSSPHRVIIDYNDPRGSSSYHVDCPVTTRQQGGKYGRIKRTSINYHIAPCRDCGQVLNTHVLAARYLEQLSKDKLASAASAITVP